MFINVFRYQAPAKIDQLKPKYQQQQPRQARLPYNAYGEGDDACDFLENVMLL